MFQPHTYGRYLLLDRVSVGGMAEIFKAVSLDGHPHRDPLVLKRVLPHLSVEPSFIKMFSNEAAFCIQLDHPNIIDTYDFGEAEGNHYITMEYVPGQDLLSVHQIVRRTGERLPAELAGFILQKIGEGLHHAHELTGPDGSPLGLIHRDVTPENILIGYDGSIRLVDFGIARAKGHTSETRSGVLKGKVGYISPEQAQGRQIDRRADVFSLGLVAFELFTGHRLFDGLNEFVILERLRTEPVPSPDSVHPNIDPRINDAIVTATHRDVDERTATAAEFAHQLADARSGLSDEKCTAALQTWMQDTFAKQHATMKLQAATHARFEVLTDGQVVEHAPPPEEPDPTALWQQAAEGDEPPPTLAMRRVHPTEISILGGRLDGTPPPNALDLLSDSDAGRPKAPTEQTPGRTILESENARKPAVHPKKDDPVNEVALTPATTIDLSHPFSEPLSRSASQATAEGIGSHSPPWRTLVSLLFASLLGLAAAHFLLPGPSSGGTGILVLRIQPSDRLTVNLDDKTIAQRAPIVIQGLGGGDHLVTVERADYATFKQKFTLAAGEETFLDIRLKRLKAPAAQVRVVTKQKKASIRIADQVIDSDKMVAVQAEVPIKIEAVATGYSPQTLEVSLRGGERRNIVVDLEPLEGSILVETRPPGTAYLNGRRQGRTPITIRELDVNRAYTLRVDGRNGTGIERTLRFGAESIIVIDEALKPRR